MVVRLCILVLLMLSWSTACQLSKPVVPKSHSAEYWDNVAFALSWPSEPVPIITPKSAFTMCTIPKVACSQWRALLARLLNLTNSYKEDPEFPHLQIYPNLMHPLYGRFFFEAFPSIVFVRNPYVRFVSYYLDKVVAHKAEGSVPLADERGPTSNLTEIIERLSEVKRLGAKCNGHWCPQTELCGMQNGLRYKHVFKIEKMAVWYPRLVRLLNIESVMRTGWNGGGHSNTLNMNSSVCFFHPPNMTCEEYHKRGMPVMTPKSSCMNFSLHSTCANLHMNLLSPYLVDKLSDYYVNDLKTFKYRLWNGVDILSEA